MDESSGAATTEDDSELRRKFRERGATGFTEAPNFSDEEASGFSAVMSLDSTIDSDLIHPEKMYSGISLLCLEGAAYGQRPFTETTLLGLKSELERSVRGYVGVEGESPLGDDPPSLLNYSSKGGGGGGGGGDKKYREPSLGPGSFAGIYESEERGESGYEKKLWLVVKSGRSELGRSFHRHLKKLQHHKDGTTDHSKMRYLMSDGRTSYAESYSKRNRARILANMARNWIGLDMPDFPFEEDKKSPTDFQGRRPLMAIPTLETVNYDMIFSEEDGTVTYHADTADPEFCEGIVVNEKPELGPVILRGPENRGKNNSPTFGGSWKASSSTFPTSCERRNAEFKAKEKQLGYDHSWGQLELKPIVVIRA